ncbi:hypothetical protein [Phormidesmis priestleyi]
MLRFETDRLLIRDWIPAEDAEPKQRFLDWRRTDNLLAEVITIC